jgi:CspA family cold shock protein
MKGTVKWYNPRKGYGFIQGEDGNDVFVHFTALSMGTDIAENDQVEYQIEDSDRGQRATEVKMLKDA